MQDFSLDNIWEESGNNAACTIGNMGRSSERKTIMGMPTLRHRLCGGKPDISRELRNSTGKWTASSSVIAELTELYIIISPTNVCTILLLMLFTMLFNGARMTCSPNHFVLSTWYWYLDTHFGWGLQVIDSVLMVVGSVMKLGESASGKAPSPMERSLTKSPADVSLWRWTLMFVWRHMTVMNCHRLDFCSDASTVLSRVPRGMTGRICRKSPQKRVAMPPIGQSL